jgi:hypothetical protein
MFKIVQQASVHSRPAHHMFFFSADGKFYEQYLSAHGIGRKEMSRTRADNFKVDGKIQENR